jgi:hypothetical protein
VIEFFQSHPRLAGSGTAGGIPKEAAMAGEQLHEFGLDLCDYVLGQFRPRLRELPARPRSVPPLDYAQWHRLDLPAWLGRVVAGLPGPLADHVWAGVGGDKVAAPLSDAELSALAGAADDPPLRCEAQAVWVPFPALHRRSVECIPEVRSALAKQTAEEWAEDSAGFAARLCEDGLSLADGIVAVHDWLCCARRLLGAMGATHLLPHPLGTHPTPTRPNSKPCLSSPRKHNLTGKPRAARAGSAREVTPVMMAPGDITAKYAISRSAVYAACQSGLLAHYRVPARRGAKGKYLVREADLVAWLESLKSATDSPTFSASAPASSDSLASPFSELNPARLAKAWQSR